MSDTKFTPGPWRSYNNGPHHNNRSIDNWEIHWSDADECVVDHVYEEADAHLIAAAPDGYALAELVMELCGQPHGVTELQSDLLYEEALSFTKKSRGEI